MLLFVFSINQNKKHPNKGCNHITSETLLPFNTFTAPHISTQSLLYNNIKKGELSNKIASPTNEK